LNFESAPFKLTREYVDLLGGVDSPLFHLFEDLFLKGFLALQQQVDSLAAIVQLYFVDDKKAQLAADALRSRLLSPQSHVEILSLIGDSLDNWRTRQYDWFQQQSNNISM
jgi:phosphatidylinositol 4-kinase B